MTKLGQKHRKQLKFKKAILTICFLLIPILFLHKVDSGDFFHNLNTGRNIFQHHNLPHFDDLTFSAYGKPWIAHSWGSGLVYYFIYKIFGYFGINILFSLLGLLSSIILYLTLGKLKSNFTLKIIFTLLAAAIASLRWPTRPEVLGTLFPICLIYFLLSRKKLSIYIPAFFWFWGIFYGASTLLGLAILVLWIISTKSFNKRALIIFTASVTTSTLNGYEFSSLFYIFKIPKVATNIGEWQPLIALINKNSLDLTLYYQYIVLTYSLFIILYIIAFTYTLVINFKLISKNSFLFAISFFAFAPLYSNRFIEQGVFLATPALAITVSNMPSKIRHGLIIISAILISLAIYTRANQQTIGLGLSQWPFQTKVTTYLKENNINGNIFSSQEIGSFLSWYLPNSKVFADTRDDLFIETDVVHDVKKLSAGIVNIFDITNKYGANIIIGRITSANIYKPVFYSNEWQILLITDGYFIATRKQDFPNINGRIDSIDPYLSPPTKSGKIEGAEAELNNLIKSDNKNTKAKLLLVDLKLAKGQAREAEIIFNSIPAPKNANIFDKIARQELAQRIYLQEHKCKQALQASKEVENLRKHKFIFSPNLQIPTNSDGLKGEYALMCAEYSLKIGL